MDRGAFTQVKVSYKVEYWLKKPVESLVDEVLERPFRYSERDYSSDQGNRELAKAIKAVIERPGQLCYGSGDPFISLNPKSLEAAEEIFKAEFHPTMNLDTLRLYGGDFSSHPKVRRFLKKPSCRHICFQNYWGQLFAECCGTVPLEGAWFIRGYLERNKLKEGCCGDLASYKAGCFEFKSKNPPIMAAVNFTRGACRVISACSHFADFLMQGDRKACAQDMENRLVDVVMDGIRLNPIDFIEHENLAISRFVKFCVGGSF